MKLHISFSILLISTITSCSSKKTNYPDSVDANNVPAQMEEREEEVINLPDKVDTNRTPAHLENRAKDEEREYEEFLNDDNFWQ